MKQRVIKRYFEDVSTMLTINMMTFCFRLAVGVYLLYFTAETWNSQVVINALELVLSDPAGWLITLVTILPGVVGGLLVLGLFTRQAAAISVAMNAVGVLCLAVAWTQGVNLNGSNLPGVVFDPMMTYLPQMTYNLGFILLGLFLLVVPTHALEFNSLDGKFFPTPTEKKEPNE